VNDPAVHPYFLPGFIGVASLPAGGIRAGGAFGEEPFVAAKRSVIFGVNDGEFALSERDFSKWVAEANPPIQKQDKDGRLFEPVRDFYDNFNHGLRHFDTDLHGYF